MNQSEPQKQQVIMSVEQCTAVSNCKSWPGDYSYNWKHEHSYCHREATGTELFRYALDKLEIAWKKDQETHQKNVEALKPILKSNSELKRLCQK
jgi:hypothetical protein